MNGAKPTHDSAGHATYQSTKKSVKFIFVAFAQEKHATIPPNAKAVVQKKTPGLLAARVNNRPLFFPPYVPSEPVTYKSGASSSSMALTVSIND